ALLRWGDRLLRAHFAPAIDHVAARRARVVVALVRHRRRRGAASPANGRGPFWRRAQGHATRAAAATRTGIADRDVHRIPRPVLRGIEALSTSAAHVSGHL